MDIDKVDAELHDIMANPLQRKVAKALIDWIEDRSPVGKVVIDLLEKAENGNFR